MKKKDYVSPMVIVEPLLGEFFMVNDSMHPGIYGFEDGGELPDSED